MRCYNPPESSSALWYDPQINRFVDEDGYIRHDLHEFFDLWQLDEWKKTRDYGLLVDRKGDLWELYYPINYDMESAFDPACDHDCNLCGSKCEIFIAVRDWEKERNYIQIRKEIFG